MFNVEMNAAQLIVHLNEPMIAATALVAGTSTLIALNLRRLRPYLQCAAVVALMLANGAMMALFVRTAQLNDTRAYAEAKAHHPELLRYWHPDIETVE
jgi:hypothetical protein